MILDKADALYFTNDVINKYRQAKVLYSRLIRRLEFVPTLLESTRTDEPLVKAYQNMEYSYGLTVDALSQLKRISETAKLRLSKMLLGQDLFCHSENWVPRLSMTFYESRVKSMLENFRVIEQAYEKYAKAEQKQQILSDQIGNARSSITLNLEAIDDRIRLINNPDGELNVAAVAIAQYTPKLSKGRSKLATSLDGLKNQIERYFHISVENILQALSMLAFAPHASMAAVQVLDVGYKSWSKIKNSQDIDVSKEYIVDQIETCTGTIRGLVDTYRSLSTGELNVDDPGSAKIVATAETLQKLLEDFRKAIPAEQRAEVKSSLEDFLSLVKKRNDAVITYNAQVQYLIELKATAAALRDEAKKLSSQALQLNPALPAIYFWLKRLRSTSQLDIMQRLNYEGRALAFWGPLSMKKVRFDPPGPLDGYLHLSAQQARLESMFEECYGGLQDGAWSHWPGSRNPTGPGILVDISSIVLDQLRTPTRTATEKGGLMYEAAFNINPNSHHLFQDMANVRLTQVRVWLPGATVAPDPRRDNGRWLKVEIEHTGGETVWDKTGASFDFVHEPFGLQFRYDAGRFNREKRCSGDPGLVDGEQAFAGDYRGGNGNGNGGKPTVDDRPPLGPFADWRVTVLERVNPGLDIEGLEGVWVEFCLMNLPARWLQGVMRRDEEV